MVKKFLKSIHRSLKKDYNKTCLVNNCLCTKPFNSDEELYNHLVQKHAKNKQCSWKNCNKSFRSKNDLIKHLIKHTYFTLFTYPESNAKALSANKTCNVNNCPCSESFNSDKELYDHLTNNHAYDEKCRWNGCNKSFSSKFHLIRHIIIHTHYRPFTCPECDKSYNNQSNLDYHLNKKHND